MKRLHTYAQHFLSGPTLVKELIGHSNIRKNDTVLDIGAGSGVISAALATRCKHVIAVEAEPRAAQALRKNARDFDNITVHEADILQFELPKSPYKVFSNIPFHLSSQIVRRLTEAAQPPTAIYLIVQKQFAKKLLPNSDGFTGQLGMIIGPLYVAKIRRPLRRSDYTPPPNVDTVLLELKLREESLIQPSDMPRYRTFVTECFSTPKIFAKTPREAVGLPADIKPSQMNLKHWVRLFEATKQKKTTRNKRT